MSLNCHRAHLSTIVAQLRSVTKAASDSKAMAHSDGGYLLDADGKRLPFPLEADVVKAITALHTEEGLVKEAYEQIKTLGLDLSLFADYPTVTDIRSAEDDPGVVEGRW